MSKWIIVDVESDGPVPPIYSMVSFGAIVLDRKLETTFYGKTKPISDKFINEALAISGHSRAEHETFDDPEKIFKDFERWLLEFNDRVVFVSDNVAYDWQWINYYFHKYIGYNPFGYSGRRIGDLFCGMQKNVFSSWKHLRKTKHTHHPVDDAKGNAEALLEMNKMGLTLPIAD